MIEEFVVGSKSGKYTAIDIKKGRVPSEDIFVMRCECGSERKMDRKYLNHKLPQSCPSCARKESSSRWWQHCKKLKVQHEIRKEVPIMQESKLNFYDIGGEE